MPLALTDISAVVSSIDSTGTIKTVGLPQDTIGTTEGAVMFALISYNIGSSDATDNLITPTGWTKEGFWLADATSSTPGGFIYKRLVPAGGLGAEVDFDTTSSVNDVTMSKAFAVQNAEEDIGVIQTAVGTSATLGFPAATAPNAGGLTIRMGVIDDNDDLTGPTLAGHTQLGDWQTNSNANGASHGVWVQLQGSTSIPSADLTLVASEEWLGITFQIQEAGGGPINTTAPLGGVAGDGGLGGPGGIAGPGGGIVGSRAYKRDDSGILVPDYRRAA